jgi:hypothetical protein
MVGSRLAVGFALVAVACQSEYPIAPTACDEWCHVTRDFRCEFYDPADCVWQCELRDLPWDGPCRVPFDAAMDCVRNSPEELAALCSFGDLSGGDPPPEFSEPPSGFSRAICNLEFAALSTCSKAGPGE